MHSNSKINKVIKKVKKAGHSLRIYLPREVTNYGFHDNTEINIDFEENKIIITPSNPNLYQSIIRKIIRKDNMLVPIINTVKEERFSPRFEDKKYMNFNSDIVVLSYDHVESTFILCWLFKPLDKLMIYYISEDQFTRLLNGANPSETVRENRNKE